MKLSVEIDNYRALRKVRWSADGVVAVTGANDSGKTTLLQTLRFLRTTLHHGVSQAITDWGGASLLKNLRAAPDERVRLKVELGALGWELTLTPSGLGVQLPVEETVTSSGVLLARQVAGASSIEVPAEKPLNASTDGALVSVQRIFPGLLRDHAASLDALKGYRLLLDSNTRWLRERGSVEPHDKELSGSGENLFAVLRDWKVSVPDYHRWEFVRQTMREAFPNVFSDLDFTQEGATVAARFYVGEPRAAIPASAVANGLLLGLHAVAMVASTIDGGIVAIDELENGLHPFAIRKLMAAFEERAASRRLSILLTTHSPVVLDCFHGHPERVFVMEPGHEILPVRLDELKSAEWLALYNVGDLYTHDKVGRQGRVP